MAGISVTDIDKIEQLAKELGIPFTRNHARREYCTPSYYATFSWSGMKHHKIGGLDFDGIKRLIRKLKDEILFVSTESEQHYAVYNLWLRIELPSKTYMIRVETD